MQNLCILKSSTKKFQRNDDMTTGYLKNIQTSVTDEWVDHCLFRQTRKLREYILPFYKFSGSQAVQVGRFNSSIKIGRTENDETRSKIIFLFLSKSWGGGERKTELKCLGEAGGGEEAEYSVFNFASELLQRQISGEDQSFSPLRN